MPENRIGLITSNASSLLMKDLIPRGMIMDLVLGSRRISSYEALDIGLLDEIVEADLLNVAIERIHEYSPLNGATEHHLKLFRPQIEDLEQAMARETEEAVAAWKSGLLNKGPKALKETKV